jgi:DNA-binding GntR family transcriptional regulator
MTETIALDLPASSIDRRLPVGQQVHRILRSAIVAVRLRPGQALSEKEVSLALGVSRSPVREAFIRLAEESLIDIYPQYGTFVAKISPEAVTEAQFIRQAIETRILEDAVRLCRPETVRTLQALVRRQGEAARAGEHDLFFDLDAEFHGALAAAAGHPLAWALCEGASAQLRRVLRLKLGQVDYLASVVQQHGRIADAVRRRDAALAVRRMTEHLGELQGDLTEVQARHPEYFSTEPGALRARAG